MTRTGTILVGCSMIEEIGMSDNPNYWRDLMHSLYETNERCKASRPGWDVGLLSQKVFPREKKVVQDE